MTALTDDQNKYHPQRFPFHLSIDEQNAYAENIEKSGWRFCIHCSDYFIGKKCSRKENALCVDCKKDYPRLLKEQEFWRKYDQKWGVHL